MFIEVMSQGSGYDDKVMVNLDYIDLVRQRGNLTEFFIGSKSYLTNDNLFRIVKTLAKSGQDFLGFKYLFDGSDFFVRSDKIKSVGIDDSGSHSVLILDGIKGKIIARESYFYIKKIIGG